MTDIKQVWNATLTRRWHTNADLSHTQDPVGCHSARVALLALMLKPDLSRAAIVAGLAHDLGEYKVGDFPAPFKWANPDIAKQLEAKEAEAIAAMGVKLEALNDYEARLIRLCDGLDAWLWAKHNKPHICDRQDWRDMQYALCEVADGLDLSQEVLNLMMAPK